MSGKKAKRAPRNPKRTVTGRYPAPPNLQRIPPARERATEPARDPNILCPFQEFIQDAYFGTLTERAKEVVQTHCHVEFSSPELGFFFKSRPHNHKEKSVTWWAEDRQGNHGICRMFLDYVQQISMDLFRALHGQTAFTLNFHEEFEQLKIILPQEPMSISKAFLSAVEVVFDTHTCMCCAFQELSTCSVKNWRLAKYQAGHPKRTWTPNVKASSSSNE